MQTPSGHTRTGLVVVAQITGAFGVRGEVKVRPFTDDPAACLSYGPLLDASGEVVITPRSHRRVKTALAVTAPEIESREQAQDLNGTLLHVPRSALPEPEADEFYYADLEGLEARTPDGEPVGTVASVHDFGAGEVLEIRPPSGPSFYHPFTLAAVPEVDVPGGHVVVVIEEAE